MKLVYDIKSSHIQETESFIGTNFIPPKFKDNKFSIIYDNEIINITVEAIEDNIRKIILRTDVDGKKFITDDDINTLNDKYPNLANNESDYIKVNQELDSIFYAKTMEIALLLQYYLTYEIEKYNSNPHSGNIYFQLNMEEFNLAPFSDFMKSSTFQIHHLNINKRNIDPKHTFIMQAYYEGIRAELITSKFFHFFLIIEYIENSKYYKNMFSDDKIFSKEDIECLKNCFQDKVKQQKISSISRFTNLNRKEKLLKILTDINITTYKPLGSSHNKVIDINFIDTILKSRNEFFHTSKSSIKKLEVVLWDKLYPIVKEITEKLLIEKIDFD